jgi:circadian clock protein KaiC
MARRNQKEREPRLAKARTGIDGVDEITGGGLPRGRTTLLTGPAGSGKTVLALQTLVNGARRFDEPGIFVTFEEGFQQVVANAASFGWGIPSLVQKRGRSSPRLAFVDGRLSPGAVQAGTFDLSGLVAAVEFRAKEIGAKRIVFDGIDVLLVMLNDPRVERGEMCRIHDLVERTGLAGVVTMSTAGLEPPRSFMLSLSDCIIQLSHRLAERASIRAFRVVKYRGSAFIANEFPFAIASEGIEVADFGTPPKYRVFAERVSTGIPRLDDMLAGGYFRGSTVLVTGMPGTAKTTLAGAFVAAACARGERALYITLDEQPAEILRNLASVSIRLERYVRSRLLEIYADQPQATSPEEQFVLMRQRIRAHRPGTLVIDPISAAIRMGGQSTVLGVAERLLAMAKSEGITTLWTSLYQGSEEAMEGTPLHVSTVADAWIHLSYRAGRGERNRSLTVIKSRGTGHSHQVRELVLDDQGVDLADVYTVGGEALMGTARWERERVEAATQRDVEADEARKRRELESLAAEIRAQTEGLDRRRESLAAEMRLLDQSIARRQRNEAGRQREVRMRRGGNPASRAGRRKGRRAPTDD